MEDPGFDVVSFVILTLFERVLEDGDFGVGFFFTINFFAALEVFPLRELALEDDCFGV